MQNYTKQLQAPEIEILYKSHLTPGQTRPKIEHPQHVYKFMFSVEEMTKNIDYKELFYTLYLNKAGEVLAVHKIGEGTGDTVPVDIKFIMQGAILTNAANIIICHNHPSGKTTPSQQDRNTTNQVREAAALFNVHLLDSAIISRYNYYSFLENDEL